MRSTPRLFLQASLVTLGLAGALAVAAQTPAQKPAAPAATPAAAPADKVVARADGGVTVTEGDLALAADDPALSLPGMTEAQKRDLLVSYMVDLKLGARAADAAKIAEAPEFARKLAYFRDKLLLDEYLEREVKKTVTPEAARKLYEDTVKTVKPEEEVRARHILSENEDDAKKAAARVKGGEDFAKVAAELSNDPGSKGEGGDLGFFTKDRMVQPFAETAFKLAPGEVSEPVKSQFGWHVIKLEEKRVKSVPPFEEMKEQVEQYLTRKAQQDLVLKLRQNAKIERLDQPAEAKPGEAAPKPRPHRSSGGLPPHVIPEAAQRLSGTHSAARGWIPALRFTPAGMTARLVPVADIHEPPGDRRRCRHRRRDEVGAALEALAALEVAVRGRGAALLRREPVGVHGEAHRAAGLAPVEARRDEDPVEPLGLGLHLHEAGARYDHGADRGRDLPALDDLRDLAQILDAPVGARADEHPVERDVGDLRPGLQAHVVERPALRVALVLVRDRVRDRAPRR